jgi:hypothetical protein
MVDYYYTVKWGHQEEFIELFERNHWPLLKAGLEAGVFTDVRAYVPRYHGDGRADWTFLVTITYRDWAALTERGDPAEFEKMFPDQERYKAEERHRFALLDAHWDVPLEEHPLK